jgi:predicted glycosyltransferase
MRENSNLILPASPIDGGNLIAHSDLVVSAGGTMNREAAALGIPAASIYLGEWAAIDQELVKENRLRKISTAEDVRDLSIQKKGPTSARRAVHVCTEVADLILQD